MKAIDSHPGPRAKVSPMSRSWRKIMAAGRGLPRPPRTAPTDSTRKGKIARLPFVVRERLHDRLREGESGRKLIVWLNALPEVQAVLATEFGGRPINEPNLTAWRHGGYRDWLALQETRRMAEALGKEAISGQSLDGEGEAHPPLTDTLSDWVTAQYAYATKDLRSSRSARGWRLLREMTADVVRLRRGDHQTQRLELERDWRQMRIECAAEAGADSAHVKSVFPRRPPRGHRWRRRASAGGRRPTIAAADHTATTNPEPTPTLEAKGNLSQIKPQNVVTTNPPPFSGKATRRDRGGGREEWRLANGRAAAPPASSSTQGRPSMEPTCPGDTLHSQRSTPRWLSPENQLCDPELSRISIASARMFFARTSLAQRNGTATQNV